MIVIKYDTNWLEVYLAELLGFANVILGSHWFARWETFDVTLYSAAMKRIPPHRNYSYKLSCPYITLRTLNGSIQALYDDPFS